MRLIDADALVERIIAKVRDTSFFSMIMAEISNVIASLPTVDAEPIRHGHWKEVQNYYDDVYYECSACGEPWILMDGTPSDNNMNYCPNCGAKMDEVEE